MAVKNMVAVVRPRQPGGLVRRPLRRHAVATNARRLLVIGGQADSLRDIHRPGGTKRARMIPAAPRNRYTRRGAKPV